MSAPQILHIAGWQTCSFYKRAANVLTSLSLLFPTKLKVITHEYPSRDAYRAWLITDAFRTRVPDARAHGHSSSPFTWIALDQGEGNDICSFIGGHDDSLAWCREFCAPVSPSSGGGSASMVDDGFTKEHGFDYDLVVIGGGSGGLACSKEASRLGAKVAVLDFVKPSPAGTVWGLGGTCVNVGCIPKKLMHAAALANEMISADSAAFGLGATVAKTDWESMRQNVQNHIRGLNFKYRVNLRENGVTYLNKLGRVVDKNTMEVTDKKGNKSTITAARIIVAVGGRPTGLDCPGGELAISSDDIFALEKNPGKTLCVGASYISLECAGFLAGLGNDVSVAVRSILLRGFDRECADMIGSYMADHGVKFRMQTLPSKLEKVGDKIKVTFTDGSDEEFDTVLVAIGRSADTTKLGLADCGVSLNKKNGKIITKYEQTDIPNIYAIGDVMEGCPELTPVAIQAGKHLAQRLFGGSSEAMDYRNVCTVVFTPIEYGTVGYSEDDAIAEFGESNIDVYHSQFIPLEWALSEKRSHNQALTKVIVDKNDGKVLGIHYVGPNAGEVMQGFGVAMKKGITFKDLENTVGIHPTTAEEIVTLTVTKRSGESAAAGGC